MEKLELKRQPLVAPPRLGGIELDAPVLVVGELQQTLGHPRRTRCVGRQREHFRPVAQHLEIEQLAGRAHQGSRKKQQGQSEKNDL